MNFKKVHPNFGIQIYNLKINKITNEEINKIINLFEEYSLIVLKKQEITNEEQLEFSKYFGELEITKPGTIGSNSNLVILTNMDENGLVVDHTHKQAKNDRANQQWHSDSSFKIHPAHASILNGRITPKNGGNTQFICMRNIYNKLDKSIQNQLDNLEGIHHFAYSRSKIDTSMVSQIELEKFPPVVHPMVKINPTNNKKAVYFGSHTKSIKDVDSEKSSNLLEYLNDFINNEEYMYSHKWDNNDLIIWDNRSIVHRGQPYDITEPRYLVRATVSDTMSKGIYLNQESSI